MASSTDHRKTILLPILLSLTMINYALTLTLSALGISDVHLMLHLSHVNIVIELIMTIYLMIRGIRNNKLDKGFVYTGSLEAAEHLADKRMYEKKRQMKAFA